VALGMMYIAIGAVVKGLGALYGGSSKNASSSSSTSNSSGTTQNGPRTVYITPLSREAQNQASFYRDMSTSVNNLNTTLKSFSTKPAGVIVKDGLPSAGSILTNTITKAFSTNTQSRQSFSKVILGET
jgi:hypothetical protein